MPEEKEPTLFEMLEHSLGGLVEKCQWRSTPIVIQLTENKRPNYQLMLIPFSFESDVIPLTRDIVKKKLAKIFPKISEENIISLEKIITTKDMGNGVEGKLVWYEDESWGLSFLSNGITVSFCKIKKSKKTS